METAVIINQILIPLGFSFVCGFILGMERKMAHKPAGLRTQVLICLGATIFVVGGQLFGNEPARISANVITGPGFLGAGVVMKHQGAVRGMTAAALIWVNGSLGLAIGLHQYLLAGCGTVLMILALRVLGAFERRMPSKCRLAYYAVLTEESEQVMRVIKNALANCHRQEQPLTFDKSDAGLKLRFVFCYPPQNHEDFVEELGRLPEVIAVEIDD